MTRKHVTGPRFAVAAALAAAALAAAALALPAPLPAQEPGPPEAESPRVESAESKAEPAEMQLEAGPAGPAARPAEVKPGEAHPDVLAVQKERIEAIHRASQASISVFARGGAGGGSGVVITPDGYALTNFHVAKPAGDHMKCSMPHGKLYDAIIVGIDPTGDVALIKLLGRDDFPHAELADSDQVRVGDWCFAVGNPFLLATNFQPTVTWGLVSGVHRYQYPAGTLLEYADCIQTDASINPGNSGGPLFDAQGRLIGINGRGSFEKRGRVNVGVGYAISINQVKNFMGVLRSGRIVDHATLGASVSTDEQDRVVVTNILESSDAYRRGLRYGDEIVAFGGRDIFTVNAFKNALGIFPRGWRVPLSFRRDGKRFDVLARLAGVHSTEELIAKVQQGIGDPEKMPEPRPKKDPGPGDPPQPDKPKDAPPDGPEGEKPEPGKMPPPRRPGQPRITANPHAPEKMPEEVARFFQERRGYANYYFNQLHRDRIWNALAAHGDFTSLAGTWRIEGTVKEAGPAEITLGENELLARLPGGEYRVDPAQPLDAQLGPSGSGGLAVALAMWQRFLTLGPRQFGEVYYYGTVPVVGREGLADMLIATHSVIEARFLFDPATGQLAALEMWPASDVDPCEVYFSEYREVEGRQLPHRMVVLHGDGVYAVIDVAQWKLPAPAEKSP